MSSVPNPTTRTEISSLLKKLRIKIQSYLLFHGAALVLVALCGGFFLTLGFDWLQFQLRKLELPVAFRVVLALLMLGTILWVLATQVITRLLRGKNAHALALILERRFPVLNDRLITAVEMSPGVRRSHETELTHAMLEETIAGAVRSTDDLNLSEVFDWRPLVWSWCVAVFLLLSVGVTAFAAPAAFDRWQRAFVFFDEIYWTRNTRLEVVAVAHPGDRERPFRDGVYLHPQGAELRLLVRVPEGERVPGKPWIVPEDVRIEYVYEQGKTREVKSLTRRGEREFLFRLPAVNESLKFWLHGNDFVDREPYLVKIVAPPVAETIAMECDYPAYTGLNPGDDELSLRTLVNDQLDLPEETYFVLQVKSNKTLRNVTVQAGPYEIVLGDFSSVDLDSSTPRDPPRAECRHLDNSPTATPAGPIPAEIARRLFAPGSDSFRLPFVISRHPHVDLDGREHRLPAELGAPWLVSEVTVFKVYLEDSDGIVSAEPIRFSVRGVPDLPPQVESELQGISETITRIASIPVRGRISDDYGVDAALFEFKVDEAVEFRPRPFHNPPANRPREFRMKRSEMESYERFEMLPLDLQVGQTLTLTVYARDADNLNGPHESRGTTHTFKVVTREELLGLLYEREINLRRNFEQVISEVERTRKDLLDHRDKADTLFALIAGSQNPDAESQRRQGDLRVDLVNCAERSSHQMLKNRGETIGILESYVKILEELVNNGVHTRQMNERIDGLILKPLEGITKDDFPYTDESIGLFRQANETSADPRPRIDQSIDAIDAMLRHMKQVLAEMSDLADFHEALKDLKKVLEDQSKILENTEQQQKENIKNKLKDLGLDD